MDDNSLARASLPRTDTHREQRECRSCYGTGPVLLDAEYDPASGELTQETVDCFICGGSGSVPVYLYSNSRRRT